VFFRLFLRSILVLSLLGSAVPALASSGSTDALDRAADGAVRGEVPSSAQSSSWLEGVDVSNWQRTIDWSKVAAAGKRFAFIKATEGVNYDDPYYTPNREGAQAAGIAVAAYHFARPDLHPTLQGAKNEADHFVDGAAIGVGDILPVLDLERGDNLSPTKLIDWAATWLQEVKRRTGVKPIIYSGPARWTSNMNNTTQFANQGYRLWLAHWCTPPGTSGNPCPWVPAKNWGGHGWTFWQYTDCGHVPGIAGCTDLDHFNGTNLLRVKVPLLRASTNGVGSVTSSPQGIDCGTSCSSRFDPGSTVTFTATPNAGAVLVRWAGSCSGASTCQVKALGTRSVKAAFGFTLSTALTGLGQGSVTSSTGGITCDGSAGQVCSANYVAGNIVTLTATPHAGSQFDGWTGACEGSLAYTCPVTMDKAYTVSASFADDTPPTPTIATPGRLTAPASVSFDEPVHNVTASNLVVRVDGTTTDLPAVVACDDQRGRDVNCSTGDVIRAFAQPTAPLIPGQHYDVVVNPTGAASQVADRAGNPAPETVVPFRALTSLQESSVPSGWGWTNVRDSGASNGSYAASNDVGAIASLSFRGGPVVWHTLRGPRAGVAHVIIDGRGAGNFDLSAPRTHFAAYEFRGLGTGAHTIRVEVLRGRGEGVAVDGFGVNGAAVPGGDVAYRWAVRGASGASGGAFAVTDDRGAALRLRFRGTAVRWITVRGPDQGRAAVYVDGKLFGTYDDYATTRAFGAAHVITGLTDAVHTIRIVVLGTARPAATGAWVSVDGFEIT
jgi:lysozyme